MDPLAHSLVGATLAETGLGRRSPMATVTLVLGANAPDIDILASFLGRDAMLQHRRGMTHGVLGLAALPLVLVGLVVAWDAVARGRDPDRPRLDVPTLTGLAYLATLTHPLLDYLNVYGVRLLMPFDGSWFRGDTLYIADPWMWLLAGAAVVLARSRSRRSVTGWVVLATALTGAMFVADVPVATRLLWLVGLSGIAAARTRAVPEERVSLVARLCTAALVAYVGASLTLTSMARVRADSWLRSQGLRADDLLVSPQPGNPLARTVVARVGTRIHVAELRWLGEPALRLTDPPIDVVPTMVSEAAVADPSVAGFVGWARFLTHEVREHPGGYEVILRDARYVRHEDRPRSIGQTRVWLDRQLQPATPE